MEGGLVKEEEEKQEMELTAAVEAPQDGEPNEEIASRNALRGFVESCGSLIMIQRNSELTSKEREKKIKVLTNNLLP